MNCLWVLDVESLTPVLGGLLEGGNGRGVWDAAPRELRIPASSLDVYDKRCVRVLNAPVSKFERQR